MPSPGTIGRPFSMLIGQAHQHRHKALSDEDEQALLIVAVRDPHWLQLEVHGISAAVPSRWRQVGSNSPASLRPGQFKTVRTPPLSLMRFAPQSSWSERLT